MRTGMHDDFGLIAAAVFVLAVGLYLYCEFSEVVIAWVRTHTGG